ncbi:3-dehydroquinate synthase [Gluconobacter morbifer]|uniref:Multifunctional fusion protein n=1 Tax=Gluconobacter morbifer G707 TaxID=1088869 RepID=G6XG82_9PROT|nr:3-dehydroquinate synthase [Gluconobacter morbifer]EHH69190.1 shikimate kinase [Gluconobacter morbifer G707]
MSRLPPSPDPFSAFPLMVDGAPSRTIVLIGMMGVGKTTIGRRLAQFYGLPFVDADSEIERAAGCSIPEIFARHGEASFRDGERRVIQRLLDGPPCLLATGGGAWMDAQTRHIVRQQAVSIWLKAPVHVLLKRVSSRGGRPLLAQGDPEQIMTGLVGARYPLYAEADIIIDCGDETVEQGVRRVHEALTEYHQPEKVPVILASHQYDVLIGPDLISRAGAWLAPHLAQKRVVVITDDTVAALHLPRLLQSFSETGIRTDVISVSPGEESKSLATYGDVMNQILSLGIERKTTIVALGGGVVGDLAGFIAATVLRGVPFIQLPTTLLSQVDSSVGGKTGINAPAGKNLIGAFHQPVAVLADSSALATLPRRQRMAGYAEILKAGLIADRTLFEWCEKHGADVLDGDPAALTEAVRRACAFKAAVVAADEREQASQNGRALLNLGHTFGHALEAELGYDGRLLHGEAVSIGLHLAMALSVMLSHAPKEDLERLDLHLRTLGMPTSFDWFRESFSAQTLLDHMTRDKKMQNGRVSFILLHGIGSAFTTRDVSPEILRKLLINEGCRP